MNKIVIYRIYPNGALGMPYEIDETDPDFKSIYSNIDEFIKEQDQMVLEDWRINQNFSLYKHGYAVIEETRIPQYSMTSQSWENRYGAVVTEETKTFYTLEGVKSSANWFSKDDWYPEITLIEGGITVPYETLFDIE